MPVGRSLGTLLCLGAVVGGCTLTADDPSVPPPPTGITPGTDAGSHPRDVTVADTGAPTDTGVVFSDTVTDTVTDIVPVDLGTDTPDAGESHDGGDHDDAPTDVGSMDGGGPDTGVLDTGVLDTGAVDAGAPDMGVLDTGTLDAGSGMADAVTDVGVDGGSTPTCGTMGTPTLTPPHLVAPLSGSVVTVNTPRLEWAIPAGATGFVLQYSQDRTFMHGVSEPLLTTANAYDVPSGTSTALGPGTWFWRVRVVAPCRTAFSPPSEFVVPPQPMGSGIGTYWGTLPDLDGDGFPEVAVGAPAAPGSPTGAGHVFVYRGSGTGSYVTDPSSPTWTLSAPSGDADAMATLQFGTFVSGAGDVDGDGVPDLLVGAGGLTAYVFYGSASTGGGPTGGGPSNTAYTRLGIQSMDMGPPAMPIAISLAALGDYNHDGYGDIAEGAPVISVVRIYWGGPRGSSIIRPASIFGSGTTGSFVAAAGDFNGDRTADLVYGARPPGDSMAGGLTFVSVGTAAGTAGFSVLSFVVNAPGTSGFTGWGNAAAGVGDVDGDGVADIAVTDAEATGSSVYVVRGDATFIHSPMLTGISPSPLGRVSAPSGPAGNGFGAPLVAAGDVNADGFADFLVGSPGNSSVVVAYGSRGSVAVGMFTTATIQPPAMGQSPTSLAAVGNLDNDPAHTDDILLGFLPRPTPGTGTVRVVPGSTSLPPSGVFPPGTLAVTSSTTPNLFGRSLATGR